MSLTPQVRSALQALGGDVRYVTAPDLEHHIYLGEWYKAFPHAKFIAPDGLAEKRARQKQDAVPFAAVFSAQNKAAVRVGADFDADFEYELVEAHPNKELVFHYRPDRTLIEADLLMNLPATEQYSRVTAAEAGAGQDAATTGFISRLAVAALSTQGSAVWQKRFLWYGVGAKDRPSLAASAARINGWNFDRIIPAHGDVIETGGKGVFQKVFEWYLSSDNSKKNA